jgi:hypothetical protein
MGERQNGGAPGRRRVHPGADVPDRQGTDGLEKLLADAMRGRPGGSEGEQRAVAAFRAAREAGAHRARTRRRDDWRPRAERHPGRSLKTTLSVLVASLTIGGVAFAAIGTSGSSSDDSADRARERQPHSSASEQAGGTTPDTGTTAPSDHPVTAQDTEAHCRAYEKVQGRGNALDSTAWQRLIEAAGGEEKVAAYCVRQLAQAGQDRRDARPSAPGQAAGKGNAPTNVPSAGAPTADTPGNSAKQPEKTTGKKKQ